jgi:hypothetical protein
MTRTIFTEDKLRSNKRDVTLHDSIKELGGKVGAGPVDTSIPRSLPFVSASAGLQARAAAGVGVSTTRVFSKASLSGARRCWCTPCTCHGMLLATFGTGGAPGGAGLCRAATSYMDSEGGSPYVTPAVQTGPLAVRPAAAPHHESTAVAMCVCGARPPRTVQHCCPHAAHCHMSACTS